VKKKMCIVIAVLVVFAISGVAYSAIDEAKIENMDVSIEGTDKVRYDPASRVKVNLSLNNSDVNEQKVKPFYRIYKNGELQEEKVLEAIEVQPEKTKEVILTWETPKEDFSGYLMEAGIKGADGHVYASDTIGIDVSSIWIKFPRYGYLCDFDEGVDAAGKIDLLSRYHINGLEYYDWQYRHHMPLPESSTAMEPGKWDDWAGRTIDGNVITGYIKNAKNESMTSMAYNMIYAGTDAFFVEKPEAEKWKLFFDKNNGRGEGEFKFHMGSSPSGNGNLFFLNPLNTDWQDYIFAEEIRALKTLGFDGWHGDTVGEWGKMVTADGKPLGKDEETGEDIRCVKDTYRTFLNNAKKALGDFYLSFNPVGAQGIEQADTSNEDVLYTEFWPWDCDRNGACYDNYNAIQTEVERACEESRPTSFDGKGKSLTVKAYINYEKTNGHMNAPAVLLMDAAVYSGGGNRLELGNGDRMLHKEYYPDDNVLMEDDLKQKMKSMADFTVAYENLLRDGQKTVDRDAAIDGEKCSTDGLEDTIWVHVREDEKHEILHLINLTGVDNKWRDEIGKKKAPTVKENLNVKYYTDADITSVKFASPDRGKCMSSKLKFEKSKDDKGNFIRFSVPSLEYWDMIYMEKGENGR